MHTFARIMLDITPNPVSHLSLPEQFCVSKETIISTLLKFTSHLVLYSNWFWMNIIKQKEGRSINDNSPPWKDNIVA